MSYWFSWMLQKVSANSIRKNNNSRTNLLHFLVLLQVCYKNFHTLSFSFIVFINYVSSFNYPCVPFKFEMVYWSTAGSQNYCNWKLPKFVIKYMCYNCRFTGHNQYCITLFDKIFSYEMVQWHTWKQYFGKRLRHRVKCVQTT